MPPLAGISGKEAIRKFARLGYVIIRQRGSHVRLRHEDPTRRPITIPLHKELKLGLLRQLIKDAGLEIEDFVKL
jgi:predicted RNA binding protein YcfA (HicA-like mRNA interferase family)